MRRLVAILMLVVLSVQFSWAAAASYCEHDQDASTQHVGHHEHQHGQPAAEADEPVDAPGQDGSKAGRAHADCASCHLTAAKTISSQEMPVPDADACVPTLAAEALVDSQLLDRIERPKWHRA